MLCERFHSYPQFSFLRRVEGEEFPCLDEEQSSLILACCNASLFRDTMTRIPHALCSTEIRRLPSRAYFEKKQSGLFHCPECREEVQLSSGRERSNASLYVKPTACAVSLDTIQKPTIEYFRSEKYRVPVRTEPSIWWRTFRLRSVPGGKA